MIDLNYMTTKTAAEKWNISQRRVLALCEKDRIEGLARVENIWLIPKDAKKPVDARTLRRGKEKKSEARPFLKWAGGKGQILEAIRRRYPPGLGGSLVKYAEPFVGGGAVLFDILNHYRMKQVFISDTNAELMNVFRAVKENIEELISILARYQAEYIPLEENGRKQYYYGKRDRFNEIKKAGGESVEAAALFIFLNRTCFNGLYRVNRQGQFNVPMGAYKRPLICDGENLRNVSKALQHVEIVCGDYQESAGFIDETTFVYFDPPYRPLTATAGFTAYTEGGFADREQAGLARFAEAMGERGAKILLSNSDPKNSRAEDTFFDDLYASFHIERVHAVRAINSDREKRGKITELLISNYESDGME